MMLVSTSSIFSGAVAFISLLPLVATQSFSAQYCSSLNTADTAKNSSIYQSNGLCHDFCIQEYAFAVVQADGCWCSDYIPATTSSGCIQKCPGFPDELCGGVGVYGYIQLLLKPSGTRGAIIADPVTTAPPQQTATSTLAPQPSSPVVVVELPSDPVTTQSSSRTSSTTTTTTTSKEGEDTTTTQPPTSRSSSTWTPTPIISLETVTGQVRTVTVTPTIPPSSQNTNLLPTSSKKGGLSTGGAVGLTVGLVALIAIIAAITWFIFKKKRKEKEAEYVDTSRESISAAGGPIPSRSMSENSRYVLGTDGRQVVETWVPEEQPGQRKSRLVPVDQRLDPFSLVYQHNMSKSQESVNTIRDDHDYSRRVAHNKPILRATNPD